MESYKTDQQYNQPTTLIALLHGLTPAQAWKLGGAMIAAAVSLVTFGGWIVAVSEKAEVAKREIAIVDLKGDLEKATKFIKGDGHQYQQLAAKSEFLERYLAYKIAPGDLPKKLFADHVCALWRRAAQYAVGAQLGSLDLEEADIRLGLPERIKELLRKQGVEEEWLARATDTEGIASVAPSVLRQFQGQKLTRDEAIARIRKYSMGAEVRKVITFSDGSQYQVPTEIAVEVHSRGNCAP